MPDKPLADAPVAYVHEHRLSTGRWELRTPHKVLGIYVTKRQARNSKQRLLRRGKR